MFHHRWISVLRLLKSKMPMGNPLIATGKTSTDYLQCVDVPCHHQTYRIGDAPPGCGSSVTPPPPASNTFLSIAKSFKEVGV
jgi:hypothetical protein